MSCVGERKSQWLARHEDGALLGEQEPSALAFDFLMSAAGSRSGLVSTQSPDQPATDSGKSMADSDAASDSEQDEASTSFELRDLSKSDFGSSSKPRRRRWPTWVSGSSRESDGSGRRGGDALAALEPFSEEGAADDAGLVLRDRLYHVKGWWRKGPTLGERMVELRKSEDGLEYRLSWQHLNKAGQPDDKVPPRSLESLRGSVAEAVPLPEHPHLYGWRLHTLPDIREDPMDFACTIDADRSSWLNALSVAAQQHHDPDKPLCGRLSIKLCSGSLEPETAANKRCPAAGAEVFLVTRFGDMSFRTAPRRWLQQADVGPGGCFIPPADFDSRVVEFPVHDDNPDAKVTFEVWLLEKGRRSRKYGCVHVPLFAFGRNDEEGLGFPVWDADSSRRHGDEIGTLTIRGKFSQPLISLLMPTRPRGPGKTWNPVGDKPLREQIRELEDFMNEFEIFSSRFMYHCDMWRDVTHSLRSVLEWDTPLTTLVCIAALTVIIGLLYEYALPLGVLTLLCFAAWYHPRCAAVRTSCERRLPSRSMGPFALTRRARRACWSGLRRCKHFWQCRWCAHRASGLPSDTTDSRCPEGRSTSKNKPALPEEMFASQASQASSDSTAAPRLKELFQNERRSFFGRFSSQRLRILLDPPAWCTREGTRAEEPRQVEDGVAYVWRVAVDHTTDSDGWQYARSFGRGVVWRSTFNHNYYVRRRHHVGYPAQLAQQPVGSDDVGCMVQERRKSLSPQLVPNADPASPPSGGAGSARRLNFWSAAALPAPDATGAHFVRSPREDHRTQSFSRAQKSSTAPEFGIAKTPFHDMYQQYLLRWAYLQRQIEYWMDWYEKRKNLVVGSTLSTHTLALVAIFVLLVVAWLLPTRLLILGWLYSFFYEGWSQGRLMRENHRDFINKLKAAALQYWLENDEAKRQAQEWQLETPVDVVINSGVRLLGLRDWVQNEFFEGRPMVPLRTVQRCITLSDLAQQVTWTSDHFQRRRERDRVWWKSTFRNLLDHVRSDITLFEPMTHTGWAEPST